MHSLPQSTRIDAFRGPYRFLSNFASCYITHDGWTFPSVENAYQAFKSLDPQHRYACTQASPAAAKQLGQRCALRPGWETMKLQYMFRFVNLKFMQQPYASLLADTRGKELIEGNHWNDTFWGVCNGVGENWLGRILMSIRDLTPLDIGQGLDVGLRLMPEHEGPQ